MRLKILSISVCLVFGLCFNVFAGYPESMLLNGDYDQSFSILDANQTGLDITGDITIEAWVKAASSASYVIACKHDYTTAGQQGYRLRLIAGTPMSVRFDYFDSSANNTRTTTNAGQISIGVWYHIAVTADVSAQDVKIYIDGTSVAVTNSSTAASTINDNTTPFAIGLDFSAGVPSPTTFDGFIDDIVVFNDVRTPTEITADYNAGCGYAFTGSESGMVAGWLFDGDNNDITSNNNDLTNNNSCDYVITIPHCDDRDEYIGLKLSERLVGYWQMDETSGTRYDETGNDNDLTDNNTVGYTTGLISNGADFELSNAEYLSIADASQSGLDLSGNFTVSAWFKLEQLPSTAGTDFDIITKWSAGDTSYVVGLRADTDALQVLFYDASANLTRTYTDAAFVVSGDVGDWVFLVLTVSPSTQVFTAYKNGVAVADTLQNTAATSIKNSSAPFMIGARDYPTSPRYFDGVIDEVGVWSKILPRDDIDMLYNLGTGFSFTYGLIFFDVGGIETSGVGRIDAPAGIGRIE